jgi:hypothetical protein
MAATVVRTVMPGGDYSTLAGWEAGQQGNLITGDTIQVAECYTFTDTTAVMISGWTTDADHYIHIRVPTSDRHTGLWRDDRYSFQVSGAVNAIEVGEDHVRIEGLQIKLTASSSGGNGILAYPATNGDVRISHCIVRGVLSGTANAQGLHFGSGAGVKKVWNCVFYDWINGANAARGVYFEAGPGFLYSNTAHNCATGFRTDINDTVTAKNNLAYACTDGYNGIWTAASTNNLSSLASDAPGSNAKNSATVTFEDEAGDNFHLSINDTGAINFGADLSADADLAFTDDIDPDGGTRVAPWDIGADELIDPIISNERIEVTQQTKTARVYR